MKEQKRYPTQGRMIDARIKQKIKNGLTMDEIIDILGVTRQMLHLYRSGDSLPKTKDFAKFAGFLGLDASDLLPRGE
jgi:transcriptional regulator with XRE-family HTH domain